MQLLEEEQDVRKALEGLGLDEEVLREAVVAGETERIACSPFFPVCFPGTAAWAHTFARLAEALSTRGWRSTDVKNLPLVVHPVSRIAIAVTSGNEATGRRGGSPTTKYSKGPVLQGQVKHNQLCLFEDQPEYTTIGDPSNLVTWMLLVRSEYRPSSDSDLHHVVRFELSLPLLMEENGQVTKWASRILLDPVSLNEPFQATGTDTAIDPVEFEIDVKRR